MDKKRKDAVIRATVDRAALLRGVLMLTALALLLCFGLKPSRAAAPDAEDGALTASDTSARLSAECELLQRVTEARTAAMGATNINDKIAADNQLTGALAGLKVQLEAYPDLKANQNFMQLQTEIADIENKLAATRRFFNSATRELNNAVQVFPSNIIAQMFGFHKEMMFEIPQTDREAIDKAPEIKF